MITEAEFIQRTGTIAQAIQQAAYATFGHAPSAYYMTATERNELIEFIAANPLNVHTKQYTQAGDNLSLTLYYLHRDTNISVYRAPTVQILEQP